LKAKIETCINSNYDDDLLEIETFEIAQRLKREYFKNETVHCFEYEIENINKSIEEFKEFSKDLLKQLKDNGVKDYSLGFIELKDKISEWVKSEDGWEGTISFSDYGRIAEVDLPKYTNRSAGINFKVKKAF
jgi:hypothetical protein